MKHFWILITDKIDVLAIDDGSIISLPNHVHWPAARPFKKNNMLDALFEHILCGMPRPKVTKTKMKRAFGMPPKSCWAVYEVENVDLLVKKLKRLKTWWTVHADANLNWRARSISILDLKFDVTSASIVQDFLKCKEEERV